MKFLAAFLALPLLAQVDTGGISGTVSDPSGAVIPGVKVTLTHTETNIRTALTTNASGFFAAPALKVGRYSVGAAVEGFRPATRPAIDLHVQERLEINFTLQVGSAASEVTVTAAAPLLESETSSLGQVVEQKTITDLPLNGRNFIQLATLTAGTLPSSRTAERDNFIANGARAIQNSYLLDGVENKNRILGFDRGVAQIVQPVLDAIQEFKVQTSTFSAEFGQAAGGVVNVTLRSGTNDLHGSAFEFFRNSKLDALPYFQPSAGGRPAFLQNQFGATLGGPVKRSQTFFFASWQTSREVNAAPQIASVPLQPLRDGNFGATRMYDPATLRANPAGAGFVRDLFPNNVIPSSRWDPVSVKFAALFPQPNQPGAVRNFYSNPKERVYANAYNFRGDHRIGARDSIFGRYSASNNDNTLPAVMPPPANDVSIASPNAQSVAVSESHTFSGAKLNEVRFAFVRTQMLQSAPGVRRFAEFGVKGAEEDPAITGLPTVPITNYTTLGTTGPGDLPIAATGGSNMPIDKVGRVWQFIENFSWVKNRHTLKAGADIQQVSMYGYVTNSARPQFAFNGVYTQNPQARAGTGHSYGDFLLGLTSNAVVATRSISEIRQRIFQGYLQDDWKVSNNLTLNLGVRYELSRPFVEVNDNQSNFLLEPGPNFGKLILAKDRGASGLDRALIGTDWNNFAPRLGFAWQSGKTVVRGGSGLFYGRDENIGVGRRLTNNPPYFIQSRFVSDQINPSIVFKDGLPANALDPAKVSNPELNAHPRNSPMAHVLQWNLNVQRELPRSLVAQIGYTGSGTKKLLYVNNVNLPTPGPGNVDARRPIQGAGGVFYYAPLVNGTYHALLAKIERRFHSGLSLLGSYTYGHAIDGGKSNNDQTDPDPPNPRNLRLNKGNSNYDVRHRFVYSGVYELPFGKGKALLANSKAGSALAGGWQLSGIFSSQTGQPFTVSMSTDNTNTGATGRPDRLREGSLPASRRDRAMWFDIAAFAPPSGFNFGNSGRNILRAPGQTNLDLSVARLFTPGERIRIQFRGEIFNVTNTPQFGLPNATVGSAQIGIIGTVVNPERQIQLALKLLW
jgi:hypothetical protein